MVSKWALFKGVIALVAILLTSGMVVAQTPTVVDVQSADFQNGNTVVEITGSITCGNDGVNPLADIVVFEAVQNQGRLHAVGVLEVPCAQSGPYVIPVFEGLKFRSGPFTLLVKILNSSGVFISGHGFNLNGH